jgi:acetate kinase
MDSILVVNAGSSSVKFEIFAVAGPTDLTRQIKGQVDGIGTQPRLRARRADGAEVVDQHFERDQVPDVPTALHTAGTWLREEHDINPIAVGHRVVHGGAKYDRLVLVDANVFADLQQYIPLAPLHQPNNLAPIRSILERFPHLPQVACFDTGFHRGHGALADHYAIPEPLYQEGVRRYGFHGLSYEYIQQAMEK